MPACIGSHLARLGRPGSFVVLARILFSFRCRRRGRRRRRRRRHARPHTRSQKTPLVPQTTCPIVAVGPIRRTSYLGKGRKRARGVGLGSSRGRGRGSYYATTVARWWPCHLELSTTGNVGPGVCHAHPYRVRPVLHTHAWLHPRRHVPLGTVLYPNCEGAWRTGYPCPQLLSG